MQEVITNETDIINLINNKVIGDYEFNSSRITFNGNGNILISSLSKNNKTKFVNSNIIFNGNNSIIFLDESKKHFNVSISIFNNSSCYIGSNNYFNGRLNIVCSEEQNIIIGDNSIFSFDSWLRTSDAHPIYSTRNHERSNYGGSILIGDHVWIGQSVKILKRTTIGSGSIIATGAVVAGKTIYSNSSWGGNPAKLLKNDVFFLDESTHKYMKKESDVQIINDSDEYIFTNNNSALFNLKELDTKLKYTENVDEKIEILYDLSDNNKKNRFYIEKEIKKEVKLPFFNKLVAYFK